MRRAKRAPSPNSKNGGLVTTRSAAPSASPPIRRARASKISAITTRIRGPKPFRTAFSVARPARAGSISTQSAHVSGWRTRIPSATAPTPAPTSTMRPSDRSAAAASRAASEPIRWPRRGCSSVSRPPSHRSHDSPPPPNSPAFGSSGRRGGESGIAQLVGEAGFGQESPGAGFLVVRHKDPAWQKAERPFDSRHMLIGHEAGDARGPQ